MTVDRTHDEVDKAREVRASIHQHSILLPVIMSASKSSLFLSAHARASERSAQNLPISLEVTVALPHNQSLRDMRAYGRCPCHCAV
jgi:hypothetical protein